MSHRDVQIIKKSEKRKIEKRKKEGSGRIQTEMHSQRHWSHRMIDEALCDEQNNDEKSNGILLYRVSDRTAMYVHLDRAHLNLLSHWQATIS